LGRKRRDRCDDAAVIAGDFIAPMRCVQWSGRRAFPDTIFCNGAADQGNPERNQRAANGPSCGYSFTKKQHRKLHSAL